MPSYLTWRRHTSSIWVLLAATSAFFVGLIGGLAAAISASMGGALVWWLLIERPAQPTNRRGAAFGVLTVVSAHFLWVLVAGSLGLPLPFSDIPIVFDVSGPVPSLTELSKILSDTVWWGNISLAFGGIITVPLGALAGLVLVYIRRKHPIESERQSTEDENIRQ